MARGGKGGGIDIRDVEAIDLDVRDIEAVTAASSVFPPHAGQSVCSFHRHSHPPRKACLQTIDHGRSWSHLSRGPLAMILFWHYQLGQGGGDHVAKRSPPCLHSGSTLGAVSAS